MLPRNERTALVSAHASVAPIAAHFRSHWKKLPEPASTNVRPDGCVMVGNVSDHVVGEGVGYLVSVGAGETVGGEVATTLVLQRYVVEQA